MIKTKSGKVLPVNTDKKKPSRIDKFIENGEGLIIYKHKKSKDK